MDAADFGPPVAGRRLDAGVLKLPHSGGLRQLWPCDDGHGETVGNSMLLVGLREAGDAIAPADASACGHHLDPNMASKLGFCAPVNATGNDLEDEAFAASHKFRPHRRPVRAAGSI
jgi:hypothetical protein